MSISSLFSKLSPVLDPAETFRQSLTHILTATHSHNLDQLIEVLTKYKNYPDTSLSQEFIELLTNLKTNHKDWGIRNLNPSIIDKLIESINGQFNKEEFEASLFHLTKIQQESNGIIPQLFKLLDQKKASLVEEAKEFLASQFYFSPDLKFLTENCTVEKKELLKEWLSTKDKESIIKSLFSKEEEALNKEEKNNLDKVCIFFESIRTNKEINESHFIDLNSFFSNLYEQKIGSVEKIKGIFHQMLLSIDERKIAIRQQLSDLMNDVDEKVIFLQKTLKDLPKAENYESQIDLLEEALKKFEGINSKKIKESIFGELDIDETKKTKIKNLHLQIKFLHEKLNKNKEFLTQELLNPVTSLLDKLIEEKQGLITKSLSKLTSLIDKECSNCPPILRSTFISLVLYKKNNPNNYELFSNLDLLIKQYGSALNEDDKAFLLEIKIKSNNPIDEISSVEILKAQDLILKTMKPLQGSAFHAADLLKKELADKRTGIAAITIQTAIETAKTELLRTSPIPIQKIYETALSYKFDQIDFKELKRLIQLELSKDIQLYNKYKDFTSTLTEKNFDVWFRDLQNIKENYQGFLPHLTDFFQEKFQDIISPYASILSILNPNKKAKESNKPSAFEGILTLIENSSFKMVQYSVGFCLKKAQNWIQRTQSATKSAEELSKINSIFSVIIEQLESTNFSVKQEREQLIALIKETLGPYQIMIDNVIAMPNFHLATNHKEIQDLKKILNNEEDKISYSLNEWITKIGEENIKKKLFIDNDYHSADDETIDKIIFFINQIKDKDLTNIEFLKNLVNSVFIQEEDLSKDYSSEASSILGKKTLQTKKDISQNEINLQKSLLVQNCSFFILHLFTKKVLGINNHLQEDLDSIAYKNSKLPKDDQDSDYKEKLIDIKYYEREQNLFSNLMKNITSNDVGARKNLFIQKINEMIEFNESNFIIKKMLNYIIPLMLELSTKVADHFISKGIEIIEQISLTTPKDVTQRLNTNYIRQITGYLNKIDRIYQSMDGNNPNSDLSVKDYFLYQMKEKIKINNKNLEIEEIFSLINKNLIEKFIPTSHKLSEKINLINKLLFSEINNFNSIGSLFLKLFFGLPCFLITSLLNNLIIFPLESIFGFMIRELLIKTIDYTHIIKSLVELVFNKLNKTTGLFHSIKQSIVDLMEDISIDDLFKPNDETDDTNILTQQDGPKQDIGEMYQSLKTATFWVNQGITKGEILEISAKNQKSKIGMNEFETKFFSETVAEGLLKLVHKITQPKFIEEKIIIKGLTATNNSIIKLDNVFTKNMRIDQTAQNQVCDNRFQKLSSEMMSKIFDRILKHATADLGPKEKQSIDIFISKVKENFKDLNLEITSTECTLDNKINLLEKLKLILFRKTASLTEFKSILKNSIRDASFENILLKINPLEKLLAELSKEISSELDQSKALYEQKFFSDKFNDLKVKALEINDLINTTQDNIEIDETIDENCFFLKRAEFLSLLEQIKIYQINDESISCLSKKTIDQINNLTIFINDSTKNWVILNKKYNLRIISYNLNKHPLNTQKIINFILTSNLNKYFTKLNQLIKDIQRKQIKTDTIDSLKRYISEELDKLTINKIDLNRDQVSDDKLDTSSKEPDLSIIKSLISRLDSTVNKIKSIEYLNFDIIQHTKIVLPCKKFVLNNIKKEVNKYKVFLNSNEIVETFFYNCVLPILT